jgi:perosamine synthetase
MDKRLSMTSEKISSPKNLAVSQEKKFVAKGGNAGIDNQNMRQVEARKKQTVAKLEQELRNGRQSRLMLPNFQVSKPSLVGREREYVLDALDSGWISSTGPYIHRFEEAISRFLGVDECLTVVNGTAALHLACLTLGLQPGDEVIVPTLTYIATASAVAYCGAVPIFVDSDPNTWNATVEAVEKAWTDRTVGVIAVHLYGLPAPVDRLRALCNQREAWLIEDCAESLGASIRGVQSGRFGHAAAFSFYGNKIISTGEGGMLHLENHNLRLKARMLRSHGMDLQQRYWHPMIGYNYRMTNVASAIGLGQAEQIDFHVGERQRIANRYAAQLAGANEKGILHFRKVPDGYQSANWLFSVVLDDGGKERRARIAQTLLERFRIETRPFFVPMHKLPMYSSKIQLMTAERLSAHGLNLPTYSGLQDQEIDYIADALLQTMRTVS